MRRFLTKTVAFGRSLTPRHVCSFILDRNETRGFFSSQPQTSFARLTPQEVDYILRANEYTHEFTGNGSVKSYDSNQLASNNPIEDTRAEAACLLTEGLLFGIFDGHGGAACAQVVAKRLFDYITACMLPDRLLERFVSELGSGTRSQLIQPFNDKVRLVDDLERLYSESFVSFVTDLHGSLDARRPFDMKLAMETAFVRLDADLSAEALKNASDDGTVDPKTLSVAMSGTVACVMHIDGADLHVAHVGDCSAVIGSLSDTDQWVAVPLTMPHDSENTSEIDRILDEHPPEESETIIRSGRLLGRLAPLRALGDFRFKWSSDIVKRIVAPNCGPDSVPVPYLTPPYLTAKPDVAHRRLTPRDRFIIVASDGLWENVTPSQAVTLVGEHSSGKVTLGPLRLPRDGMRLGEIAEALDQRRRLLKTKPADRNAATHLLRNAIGGTEYGVDHAKLSRSLSLPDDVVRVFRDDMTITVVYFDSEYLRSCPA